MLNLRALTRAAVFIDAFDAMKANVMITDDAWTITYVNPSLLEAFSKVENELRQELPRFSVATLVGSNVDVFNKDTAQQRRVLSGTEERHDTTIRVGKHAFDLTVSPLRRSSKRVGFIIEWADAEVRLRGVDYEAQIAAVSRSQAMIEFTPEGTILSANENFIAAHGYRLDEVVGKHHSMFVDPTYRDSPEYREFWAKLKRGEYQAAQYRRLAKGGKDVWIQGSYNPIFIGGKVVKVVKIAADVTANVQAAQTIGWALAALSQGNLEQRLTEPLPEGFEKLRTDFNLALTHLEDVMRSVVDTAQGILGGSSEIMEAADSLSQRTEQQAASLEETAAALDEITATVRATAKGAVHAREVVGKTKTDAEHSGDVVRQAVSAMAEIEKSSSQVTQIIGVIDEIAFQTNLLALNAGVEAARAGDAGRGFAVVASEVRALAQRSAEAAREIKTLISASSRQVEAGVKLVGDTGQVLTRIVGQVTEINGVVADISASAQEQSAALAEVNSAINSMDQVTQQNAAMVEESTAASHALFSEAQDLSNLMSRFQLGASASETQSQATAKVERPARGVTVPSTKPTKSGPRLRVVGRGDTVATRQLASSADTTSQTWTEF